MTSLSGKVGLVTGAARGLGEACARELVAQGAQVVMVDRLGEELAKTAASIGERASAVVVDLRDERQIDAMIDDVFASFGRLDFIVQNAAVQVEKPLHETTTQEWEMLHDVNLKAVFLGARRYLVALIERQAPGVIVNIGSVQSVASDPILSAYSTMKHGVLGLTRSIAVNKTYAALGIRANCVCPGDILTEMQSAYWAAMPDPALARRQVEAHYPTNRIGMPTEVANIVAFLVSEKASLINGETIVADGGRLPLYY
jgi:NAD(P)-dependent dehydrogenase (short-subunit alcohol dehydrogenase family)